MKILLIVSAIFEAPVGLLLFLVPGLVVPVLLGVSLSTPEGFVAARLAGAAILALAIACWQARSGDQAASIVAAMLFYNLAATAVIAYASLRLGLSSVFLWPVMVAHFIFAGWCLLSLWVVRNRVAKV